MKERGKEGRKVRRKEGRGKKEKKTEEQGGPMPHEEHITKNNANTGKGELRN